MQAMAPAASLLAFVVSCFWFPGAALADSGYKPTTAPAKEDVYVFGIHPYSNPQDVFESYEPVMRYLESKLPGSRFRVETSRDYADYEE